MVGSLKMKRKHVRYPNGEARAAGGQLDLRMPTHQIGGAIHWNMVACREDVIELRDGESRGWRVDRREGVSWTMRPSGLSRS